MSEPMMASALEPFHFITQLEGKLKAMVQLRPVAIAAQDGATQEIEPRHWRLDIDLLYDGATAGKTSFNLHGYSRQEAEAVARNIRSNAYLMKEIDEFLWGESD